MTVTLKLRNMPHLWHVDWQSWNAQFATSLNDGVEKWCEGHLSGQPEWHLRCDWIFAAVTFATEADMVAFKLRWS